MTDFGDPAFEAPLVRGAASRSSLWAMSLSLRSALSSFGAWSRPKLLESRGNLRADVRVSASLRCSVQHAAWRDRSGPRWNARAGVPRTVPVALSPHALRDLEPL